jgi:hypothetical protein
MRRQGSFYKNFRSDKPAKAQDECAQRGKTGRAR